MAKEWYVDHAFKSDALSLIETMDTVIEDYTEQGYRLTARQLYYQLVARDVIPNTEASYKRITSMINDAKLAGLLDWDAIEDRTREFVSRSRWESARSILRGAAAGFHMDMWADQGCRVFAIVEKEALAGVLLPACEEFDVPLLAARGYPSGTVLREFCVRDVLPALRAEQSVIVLHLGDHDPSGLDMTRDLTERMELFCGEYGGPEVIRIALNSDQIEEYKPPPNPAKMTDSRFKAYKDMYGGSSWELDALQPKVLHQLIEGNVRNWLDRDLWAARAAYIEEQRERINGLAQGFL